MIRTVRTNSENNDFRELVRELDADLAIRDGSDHTYYAQFNKIDMIKHVIIAYEYNKAVACGAIKELSSESMEVKRMYTSPGSRGKGCASRILQELEKWTAELNYTKCRLETGKRQPEAIALYQKCGYTIIPNYGQYAGIENSICFEKLLKSPD